MAHNRLPNVPGANNVKYSCCLSQCIYAIFILIVCCIRVNCHFNLIHFTIFKAAQILMFPCIEMQWSDMHFNCHIMLDGSY